MKIFYFDIHIDIQIYDSANDKKTKISIVLIIIQINYDNVDPTDSRLLLNLYDFRNHCTGLILYPK